MRLELKIPDMDLEITIEAGSTEFFDMFKLMEYILHFFRTKEWIKE